MTTLPQPKNLAPIVRRLMETGVPPDLDGSVCCVMAFLHQKAVLVSVDRVGRAAAWCVFHQSTGLRTALDTLRS